MELRHLKYFTAVARELSFTRAAKQLRVAQPALSRQIRDLEHELGITLLERNPHGVRLTAAGRAFQAEAQTVLQQAGRAMEVARAFATGARGELQVGYAPSLTVEVLPQALRRFQQEAPGVQVVLHDLGTDDMVTGVREGRLHLALAVPPTGPALKDLVFEPLRRYAVRVAVAPTHRLARARQVSLSQLEGEPLIAYARGAYGEYHQWLTQLLGAAGLVPKIVEEHDGVMSLLAAVESGRGAAVVAECVGLVAGARVRLKPLQPAPPPFVMGVVHRRRPSDPSVARFLAALRAV